VSSDTLAAEIKIDVWTMQMSGRPFLRLHRVDFIAGRSDRIGSFQEL